jgi:hypothetical protein
MASATARRSLADDDAYYQNRLRAMIARFAERWMVLRTEKEPW